MVVLEGGDRGFGELAGTHNETQEGTNDREVEGERERGRDTLT